MSSAQAKKAVVKKRSLKKVAVKRSPQQIADYNEVVRRARLVNVCLTSSSFQVQPALYEAEHEPNKFLRSRLEGVELAGDVAFGFWSWRVIGVVPPDTAPPDNEADAALFVSATYLIQYADLEGCSKEAASLFMRRVGRMTAYPYFRALVAHYASDAALTLEPLPIIHAGPPKL